MKKYLLAIVLISLGATCLIIHGTTSKMDGSGLLIEPYFFLVPVSYLLFISGIGVSVFEFIASNKEKKYLLASSPIFLGVLCIIMFNIIGSEVKPDGTLVEPFYLIPLAYLFTFTGIVAILCVALFSVIRKKTAR
ncbi:Uncharacterized protein BC0861_05732 [Bacillus mobilis]|nr:Uncharacterized protein BC0861_05732 [Bacillus mobilis]